MLNNTSNQIIHQKKLKKNRLLYQTYRLCLHKNGKCLKVNQIVVLTYFVMPFCDAGSILEAHSVENVFLFVSFILYTHF